MTYEADEYSAEQNRPLEYYTIVHNDGLTIWRHVSGPRDYYDQATSKLFTAIPIARTEQKVSKTGTPTEITLALPIDHPLAVRWTRQGVPPRTVTVTVYRRQDVSGESRQYWYGKVYSMAVEGNVAKFRIPAHSGERLQSSVPSAVISRACPYILYDQNTCKVIRTSSYGLAFRVATTVIYVNGRNVRVSLADTGRNGTWAENGELLHIASGERMTIRQQTDLNPGASAVADLTLNSQIVELNIGDDVHVFAGCDHTINGAHGCGPKFANKDNYGGFPQLPTTDPFDPAGYGAGEET